MSRTKIAKTTNTPKKTVDAGLAIAGSAHAMAAINDLLTLDQGAIIAGHEADGDTEAVTELLDAATEGRFEHKHAELVQTADERAALREGLAYWRDMGFHVSDVRPQHRSAWIEFCVPGNHDVAHRRSVQRGLPGRRRQEDRRRAARHRSQRLVRRSRHYLPVSAAESPRPQLDLTENMQTHHDLEVTKWNFRPAHRQSF